MLGDGDGTTGGRLALSVSPHRAGRRPPGPRPPRAAAPPGGVGMAGVDPARAVGPAGADVRAGLTPIRTATRVAGFAVSLLAWLALAGGGRRGRAGGKLPGGPLAGGRAAWLVLSIAHPTTNSLLAGGASGAEPGDPAPAFWAPAALGSPGRSAADGDPAGLQRRQRDGDRPVLPARPVQPAGRMPARRPSRTCRTRRPTGGRSCRPCGLTDTPGAACGAGMMAASSGWAGPAAPGPLEAAA